MPVSTAAVAHLSRVSPASAAARLAILGAAALISIPLGATHHSAKATVPAAPAAVMSTSCDVVVAASQACVPEAK